jgi:hypothetical protein
MQPHARVIMNLISLNNQGFSRQPRVATTVVDLYRPNVNPEATDAHDRFTAKWS